MFFIVKLNQVRRKMEKDIDNAFDPENCQFNFLVRARPNPKLATRSGKILYDHVCGKSRFTCGDEKVYMAHKV